MSDVIGSKDWQRMKLRGLSSSIFFCGETIMGKLLAMHCTMDIWIAVGKRYFSGDIYNQRNLEGYINDYKVYMLDKFTDELVVHFTRPLYEFQQKIYGVGGWFTAYTIELEKKGLSGIRFDPDIIFELGLPYATKPNGWIFDMHETICNAFPLAYDKPIQKDDNEKCDRSAHGLNIGINDGNTKLLYHVANSILLHNYEISGQLLSMHSTMDIFKALGKDFPKHVDEVELPELLIGHIREYRHFLRGIGLAESGVNALIAPLFQFENKVRRDPEWFKRFMPSSIEFGLRGIRFEPAMIFEILGNKYANADNRAWAVMNSIIMTLRETDGCINCMKICQEKLNLKNQMKEIRENFDELPAYVGLMFDKFEKAMETNSADTKPHTAQGILLFKSL